MPDSTSSLRERVEEFLKRPGYRPLKQHELARALHLRAGARSALRQLLRQLEEEGSVVRLRKNRWALPDQSRLVRGTLNVHVRGFGFVLPDDPAHPDIYIPSDSLGVGLHEDKVLASVVTLPGRRREPGETERLEGRIERVVERGRRTLTGLVKRSPYYAYVIPDNPRFLQDVRIRDESPQPAPPEHHKVVVELDEWTSPARPLSGKVIEDLGRVDDPGVDILSLMRDRRLQQEFPDAVTNEAAGHSPTLSEPSLEGRRDLRDLLTFTIDPDNARDFDDAVSLERTPTGGYRLGVHIADVSHYVEQGSEVDAEARARGTSVYLVDRVITMLPRYLTTEVCSLQPASDRLTRSVFVDIDPDGYGVLNRETCASVIHSRARLTYEQVQQLFDAGDEPSIDAEVKAALLEMRGLARALRQQRVQQGSIDFAMPEIKCELNAEGRVVALRRREAREAYQLIEEFMLVANQAVARIIDGRERPGLYRVHDEPDEEQWAKMSADLLALGISVLPTSRADINRITRQVDGSPIAYATQLAILKNFKRAEYVAERRSHFGLAFDYYTHFTSPIRRYPDLVTHRILGALEAGLPSPYGAAELEAVARHCSMMEREADAAEKESVDIKRVEFFQRRLWDGDVGPFKGLVTAVTPKGLIVELGESLQRGMVPFSSFVDDYYRVNPDRTQAAGRRSRRTWSVGQPVRVELTRVDTTRRLVDFRMVDQPSVRKGKGRRRNR